MVVFGLIAILHAFLPFSPLRQFLPISLIFFIGFLFYLINTVLFKALHQPDIFLQAEKQARYADSSLDEKALQQAVIRLKEYVQSQKPFLDPDLKLNHLADLLDLHPKKLSEIINRGFSKNFFHFINDLRIEEAKKLLISAQGGDRTILEILYAVGYNSKSSFNTLFKQKTGLTPSQFRKKHLSESTS